MVDARDLKSLDHCGRAGSIPALGTIHISPILGYIHLYLAFQGLAVDCCVLTRYLSGHNQPFFA